MTSYTCKKCDYVQNAPDKKEGLTLTCVNCFENDTLDYSTFYVIDGEKPYPGYAQTFCRNHFVGYDKVPISEYKKENPTHIFLIWDDLYKIMPNHTRIV